MIRARAAVCALLVGPLLCCAPLPLLACACCSKGGQHRTGDGKPINVQLAAMHHVKFAPATAPYLGPGDLADSRGVDLPTMHYTVEASFNAKNE